VLARVLAVGLCLCVCVCHTPVLCQNGCMDGAVFGLDLSYTLCFKEIRVSAEIMVFPCGTLSQTLNSENLATARRPSMSATNKR